MRKLSLLQRIKGRLAGGPRGQSLVEFTLVLPILVILMGGILDLARVYYIWVALEDSTSEGATFLAMMPDCLTAADCSDPDNAEYRIEHATSGILDWNNA